MEYRTRKRQTIESQAQRVESFVSNPRIPVHPMGNLDRLQRNSGEVRYINIIIVD